MGAANEHRQERCGVQKGQTSMSHSPAAKKSMAHCGFYRPSSMQPRPTVCGFLFSSRFVIVPQATRAALQHNLTNGWGCWANSVLDIVLMPEAARLTVGLCQLSEFAFPAAALQQSCLFTKSHVAVKLNNIILPKELNWSFWFLFYAFFWGRGRRLR